jgi:hypothetical protein
MALLHGEKNITKDVYTIRVHVSYSMRRGEYGESLVCDGN